LLLLSQMLRLEFYIELLSTFFLMKILTVHKKCSRACVGYSVDHGIGNDEKQILANNDTNLY